MSFRCRRRWSSTWLQMHPAKEGPTNLAGVSYATHFSATSCGAGHFLAALKDSLRNPSSGGDDDSASPGLVLQLGYPARIQHEPPA